jgi:hypothetical protein
MMFETWVFESSHEPKTIGCTWACITSKYGTDNWSFLIGLVIYVIYNQIKPITYAISNHLCDIESNKPSHGCHVLM